MLKNVLTKPRHYSGEFARFLGSLFGNRYLLFELTRKDLQNRYLGSYLGILWAFVHPVVMILVLWFVFQVGFKNLPVDDFPFILWLITGMIPWFFLADSLANSTAAVIEHAYLVKKVVFRVSILPIVKILSALVVHLFFVFVIFLMFFLYGYYPTIYNLQVFYYLFALTVFLLGLSWITSSVQIFFKDMGQIIQMFLQIGFWFTPIFWSLNVVPEKYHFIIKLNPIFYIIQGYRDSFIYNVWFWERYKITIFFWLIAGTLFFLGAIIFRKLRPHFADVL